MADTRKIWNVCTTVVDLVAADTAEEAKTLLYRAIVKAGFDVLDDTGVETERVFESEPLGDDIEAEVRAKRWT